MKKQIVFHVDVNSAFLSWEAVKRVQNGEQDIRLISSAIGGDREKRLGVILAKSLPAKRKGVKTGEPITAALQKCPELKLFKPDFLLYEKCSRAFMKICSEYSPVVEKYSIDECFMDMSGMDKIYSDIIEVAEEIKNRIYETCGFTVNIGISDKKILAKMASDFEKPNKIHTLFSEEISLKMWGLPINNLFSIGSSTAEKLCAVGIETIGDLAKSDLKAIQALVGEKRGLEIYNYANGEDSEGVSAFSEAAKGYSISSTLEKDIISEEEAEKIILDLVDSVAARMRSEDALTECIGITIRYNNFKDRSHQRKISAPTDITSHIFKVCKELFEELWDKKTPIRLIGVSLTNIIKNDELQVSAFDADLKKEKARILDKTVDDLRGKFGYSKITRAVNCNSQSKISKKHEAKIRIKEKCNAPQQFVAFGVRFTRSLLLFYCVLKTFYGDDHNLIFSIAC